MSRTDQDTPAFPIPLQQGQGWSGMAPCDGMTLRQYAAIKLKVPDSGIDWLDVMIVKSKRDEIAVNAMQGQAANPNAGYLTYKGTSLQSYLYADEMLKARG